MKRTIAVLALAFSGTVIAADVYVLPHVRNDGTYVQGHNRTAPDNTIQNNYSTQGNVNPYTGQAGTVNPYQQQHQNTQQFGGSSNTRHKSTGF